MKDELGLSWLTGVRPLHLIGHPDPLEDPAIAVSCDDRIITSSQDGGMAGGSTMVSSSPEKGMSTARTPWLTGGCTTFVLAVVPPDPSSSG